LPHPLPIQIEPGQVLPQAVCVVATFLTLARNGKQLPSRFREGGGASADAQNFGQLNPVETIQPGYRQPVVREKPYAERGRQDMVYLS